VTARQIVLRDEALFYTVPNRGSYVAGQRPGPAR
jgi:hypothetical protein